MLSGAMRLNSNLLVQLSVQPTANSEALATFNPSMGSRLVQSYSMREMAAALLIEWGPIRIGAGPVRVTSEWTERYDRVATVNGSYVTDFSTISDGHWSRSSMGVAGEVAAVRPISSSFYLGLVARGRAAPTPSFDGVPTHQQWTGTVNDAQIGLKAGLAW
jgi:hypothetical protein